MMRCAGSMDAEAEASTSRCVALAAPQARPRWQAIGVLLAQEYCRGRLLQHAQAPDDLVDCMLIIKKLRNFFCKTTITVGRNNRALILDRDKATNLRTQPSSHTYLIVHPQMLCTASILISQLETEIVVASSSTT
uniref:Uncharacterized protein n=1 Tax=Setaria viridis TaxID=4556 RepID=A0A4U6TTD0_SETVI|nr:hypothetical protein SEVIR_7G129100v2 [Setaria viridis]